MGTRYSVDTKRKLAELFYASMHQDRPAGNLAKAAREAGVEYRAAKRWVAEDEQFKTFLEDARAKVREMALGDNDGDILADLFFAKKGMAERLKTEYKDIPVEKLPAAIQAVNHTTQLLKGAPTKIEEHRVKELIELEAKETDELRRILAERISEIPDAMQAVENPLRADEGTEH